MQDASCRRRNKQSRHEAFVSAFCLAHGEGGLHILPVKGVSEMKLDRRALDRLLQMNDAQLRAFVDKLASEYGLDLSTLSVREGDMEGLRRALRMASDEQLLDLTRNLRGRRQDGK